MGERQGRKEKSGLKLVQIRNRSQYRGREEVGEREERTSSGKVSK